MGFLMFEDTSVPRVRVALRTTIQIRIVRTLAQIWARQDFTPCSSAARRWARVPFRAASEPTVTLDVESRASRGVSHYAH